MNKVIKVCAKVLSYLYFPGFAVFLAEAGSNIRGVYYSKKMKKAGEKLKIYKLKHCKGIECFIVGDHVTVGEDSELQAWSKYKNWSYSPEVIIGNNVHLGLRNHITAVNRIEIGDNLLTGQNVLISDNAHGKTDGRSLCVPPLERQLYSKGPVVIGNNVWISDNVCVLAGVTIGNNVIIGANSVVTKSIPSNSMAAGAPAQVIKRVQSDCLKRDTHEGTD